MEKKQNNILLYSILGGVITCFICVGMIFLFPSKETSKLKGNNTSSNPKTDVRGLQDDDEILLGDTCSYPYAQDGNPSEETAPCSTMTCTSSGSRQNGDPVVQECVRSVVNGTSDQMCKCTCTVYKTSASFQTCTSCSAGKYLSDGKCVSCPNDSYCTGGTSQPISCPTGYGNTGGASTIDQCVTEATPTPTPTLAPTTAPTSSPTPTASATPKPCSSYGKPEDCRNNGCYWDYGKTECVITQPSFTPMPTLAPTTAPTSSPTPAASATPKPCSSYGKPEDCRNNGCYWDYGKTECVITQPSFTPTPVSGCPVGYGRNSKLEQCQKCPVGTHKSTVGDTPCEICSKGTYQNQEGQAYCKEPRAGFYCPDDGMTGAYECNGTVNTAKTACTAKQCGPNEFNNTTGECERCATGYTSRGWNGSFGTTASFCEITCSAGYHVDQKGGACVLCPTGYSSLENKSAYPTESPTSECFPCSDPTVADTEKCKNEEAPTTGCPAGQGKDTYATSGCSNCAAGYYSSANDDVCHKCTNGKTSKAGASSCTVEVTAPCCVTNPTGSHTQYDDLNACQQAVKGGADVKLGACESPKQCTVSISTVSVKTSVDSDNVNNSYYTVIVNLEGQDCKGQTVTYTATNAKTITPTSYAITSDFKGTRSVSFTVKPKTACLASQATATLTNGRSSTSRSVTIQSDWKKSTACEKNPTYTSFSSADAANSDVYYSDYGTCSDGVTQAWTIKWTRGGCGGGTSNPTPTPTTVTPEPLTYAYCCIKSDKSDYKWYTNQSSPTCPSGYTIDYTRTKDSCAPETVEKIPYCYIDEDDNYHWTSNPQTNWKIVVGISNEANCKKVEDEACYLTPSNEYVWGKYATKDGYKLITAIKAKDKCVKPKEEDACYKNEDDEYVWGSEAPEGYTKVERINNPTACKKEEKPACYVHGNEYLWGKYENIMGYIKLNDETEEGCKKPETAACYISPNGEYVWGKYGVDPEYKLVPSIKEETLCKNDVPVPSTASNVSKLVYVFMAVLMACGIGFIYYSTVLNKRKQ